MTPSGGRHANAVGRTFRAADAVLLVAGIALGLSAALVNWQSLMVIVRLPPSVLANAWVKTDLRVFRAVGVVVGSGLAISRIIIWRAPEIAAAVPLAIDRLASSARRSLLFVPVLLGAFVLLKTVIQLRLYLAGYAAYGADDFSRTLSADYWLFFRRLDFGWTGWLGLSGSGWLPFPDYLFGLALAVHRDLFLTPRVVNLAISGILVLASYVLGRELSGKATGLLTAAIVAFQPWQIWLGMSGMTSDLSSITVIVFFAIYLVRWLRSGGRGAMLAAAVFLGIANGFRYDNWFFSCAFGSVILLDGFRQWRRGLLTVRWTLTAVGAFAAMGVFPVFWMIGSYVALGDWLPSLHSVNAWMVAGASGSAAPVAASRLAVSQSPEFPQISMLVLGIGAFPIVLAAAVAGAVRRVVRSHGSGPSRLYMAVVAIAALIFFVAFKGKLPASAFYARYLLVFAVLAAPYAAFFLNGLLTAVARHRVERVFAAGLVLMALATLDVGRAFNYPSVFPKDAIDLGRILRGLEQSGTLASDARILIERDQSWGDLGIVALAGRPERFVAMSEFEYQRQADLSLPSLRARAGSSEPAAWRDDVRGSACDGGFEAAECRQSVSKDRFALAILSSPDRVASFGRAFGVAPWHVGRYYVFNMTAKP